jgi:hypothetical protein
MTIQQYLAKINTLFITGKARVACGAPDYVLTRKDVPVGYIEAKDIGVDLGSKTLKEQFNRYKLGQQTLDDNKARTPNLNSDIIKQIADGLGMTFTNEKETESNVCFANSDEVRPEFKQSFAPIDILDYIYAVLHSPTYREKYKEFLKIDFPRVPVPTDADQFWKLVNLGSELRQIHLLESPIVEKYITQYPEDGDNIVTKPVYKNGNVYINEDQYFANVPEVAWNFYIGGYQPAQKWLKDRKGRELNYDDILHYQKMVVALNETDRIMKEIDKIEI